MERLPIVLIDNIWSYLYSKPEKFRNVNILFTTYSEIVRRKHIKHLALRTIEKWWKFAKYKRELVFAADIWNRTGDIYDRNAAAIWVDVEWQDRKENLRRYYSIENYRRTFCDRPPVNIKACCQRENVVPGCLCFLCDFKPIPLNVRRAF